jgi:hypothetical protein
MAELLEIEGAIQMRTGMSVPKRATTPDQATLEGLPDLDGAQQLCSLTGLALKGAANDDHSGPS